MKKIRNVLITAACFGAFGAVGSLDLNIITVEDALIRVGVCAVVFLITWCLSKIRLHKRD